MNQQVTDSLTETSTPDSLQLQQAQLEALYEPPPVPFAFETIGWEILAVLLLLLLLIAAAFWIRSYLRNGYRRQALKQLKKYQSAPGQVEQVMLLLKQSAIHAYGRGKTGNLYGREWLKFLDNSGRNVHLLELERDIVTAIYKNQKLNPEVDRKLVVNAKNWINTHAARKS